MRIPGTNMRQQVDLIAVLEGGLGPVEQTPRRVRARVSAAIKTVTDASGAERVSTAQVVLDPENAPLPESFIILQPGTTYENKAKVIIASLVQRPRKPDEVRVSLE